MNKTFGQTVALSRRDVLMGTLGSAMLSACGGGSSSSNPGTSPPAAPAPAAPVIVVQPVSVTVNPGATASFLVGPSDSAGASFQWLRNGIEISGAIQASYSTPPVSLSDTGAAFAVRVSNAAGTVISNVAVLTVASFASPVLLAGQGASSIAADGVGNLYVNAEAGGHGVVRKITADGVATTLATVPSPPTFITSLVFDRSRNALVGRGNGDIWSIDLNGNFIQQLPHTLPLPVLIAVAPDGTIYYAAGMGGANIAQLSGVYKVSKGSGTAVLLAGSPGDGGNIDGPGLSARFPDTISGLVGDANGVIYVSTPTLIKKIATDGMVSTIAGSTQAGSSDGRGSQASFSNIQALAIDASGNLFAADGPSKLIRRIRPDGLVTTVAQVTFGSPSTSPSFELGGMVFDSSGRLWVTTFYGLARFDAFPA